MGIGRGPGRLTSMRNKERSRPNAPSSRHIHLPGRDSAYFAAALFRSGAGSLPQDHHRLMSFAA